MNAGKIRDRGVLGALPDVSTLGAADAAAAIKGCLSCNFASLPVTEFVTWTVKFPVNDADLQRTFSGARINIMNDDEVVPGVTSVDTSFVKTGLLQTDIMVVGFGFHAYGEPRTLTAIGNALTPTPLTAIDSPVSPDVFTVGTTLVNGDVQTPALDGNILGVPAGSTITPAILEWGGPTWEAIWNLANAFRLQWIVRQKHLIVDEMVADVCHFASYADGYGFGTAEEPVLEWMRKSNVDTKAAGGNSIIMPINARRVGPFTDAQGNPQPSVFHPSRDFDLAPVAWGGIRNQGSQGSAPFRKLVRPCVLKAGIPIGLMLALSNAGGYHQQRMLTAMSISSLATGQSGSIFDGTVWDKLNGTTSAIRELSLDANQDVEEVITLSDRMVFKGGSMQLAMLLKGFEIPEGMMDTVLGALSGAIWTPRSGAMASSPVG